MKKIGYLFVLIGTLLLVGCEMPFPDTGAATDETVVQPTAVSDPNATSLPDGSDSVDPNVGGGAPAMPAATDVPVTSTVEVEGTAVSTTESIPPTAEATAAPPTATAIPPTPVPPTAVPPTIAPVPTATAAQPQLTHTVAPGENLYRISLQYGLSWTVIAAANGITNPDNIIVGQVLIIPVE